MYCTVLYCTVMYCTVLHYAAVLSMLNNIIMPIFTLLQFLLRIVIYIEGIKYASALMYDEDTPIILVRCEVAHLLTVYLFVCLFVCLFV